MKVIGLSGPSGSGKSAVAQALAHEPGIEWIDLDRVVWDLYRPGTEVYNKLTSHFGTRIIGPTGEIDRGELGRIVFSDAKELAALNTIVHPAVSDALQEIIGDKQAQGTKVLLVEGALLGLSPHLNYSLFDAIIWLSAPREVRRTRLAQAGREEHLDRVPDRPTQVGMITVDATGTIHDTADRVRKIIARLRERPVGAQDS